MSLNLSKTFGLIRPMTRSLLLSTSTLTRFAVNGVEAALALDFIGGEYRTANTSTTFADAFTGTSPKLTYSTAAGSNSTMVNSEGKIVWAPHNLALNSATPATQTIAVRSGAQYTVRVTGAGSMMALSGANTGTATDGSPATITASTTSLTITLTGSLDTVAVYRSDLGGMHPVPGADTGFEYYVPTNGNAEYLPRVGHHVYNGSAWVNEGLLIESEPRTNLITESTPQSGDFDLSGGSFSYVTCNFTPLSGPGIHFDTSGVSSYTYFTPTYTAADYTLSVFVEMDDGNAPTFGVPGTGASNDFALVIDAAQVSPLTYIVEHFGGNTYRVSATATSVSTTTRNTGVVKYSGNSSRTFKVTGFQLELGSTPSSYMPTNGGTYTRTAQSLTVPPAEFGWNSDAVSIQMDGRMTYSDEDVGVAVDGQTGEVMFTSWRVDASNYIAVGLSTGGTATGQPVFLQEASGTYDFRNPAVSPYTPGVLVPFNISSRHGSTFVNGAVDGVALTANTTPTALPDLSGTNLQIAYDFMGTIGTFRQFAGDIGDAGLVTATNPSTEPTLSLTFDGTDGSFYNLSWSE